MTDRVQTTVLLIFAYLFAFVPAATVIGAVVAHVGGRFRELLPGHVVD